MHADYHSNIYDCSVHAYAPNGEELFAMLPEWKRPGAEHGATDVDTSSIKRRPAMAKMYFDQLQRVGVPVIFDAKIVEVREDADGVVMETETGKVYQGDLCVAANGVGSTIKGMESTFGGEKVTVQDTGYAAARCAFPRSMIKPGSLAERLLKRT
jgi:hypothetical protein